MFLNQLPLDLPSTVLAQNRHDQGRPNDSPRQIQVSTKTTSAFPFYHVEDPKNVSAGHSAFPSCMCERSTSATTTCSHKKTFTSTTAKQRGRDEEEESAEQPETKRYKISTSAETNSALLVATSETDTDDTSYEPPPKRRKVSHDSKLNVNFAFNTDDENFADDEADTADEDDIDDGSFFNNGADTDTDDESFVDDDADTTSDESSAHDDTDITVFELDALMGADDTESTESIHLSPTDQSNSSPFLYDPSAPNSPNAPWYVQARTNPPAGCTITNADMPQSFSEQQHAWPLFTPRPRFQASRRRKAAEITVYEDETATAPGWLRTEFTDDRTRMPVSHRGLSTYGRGQENRQPVRRQVETHFDARRFLDEEDGDEEEVSRMAALEMSDISERYDE